MRAHVSCTAALLVMLFSAAGCTNKKDPSKANFEQAIDTYYSAHPECLWSSPVKFPAQEETLDEDKTRPYDALTDAGLLLRTQSTKKVFLFGSKQESNYDLSDNGRSHWTPDPTQPGYGNFCFGHRKVVSIDSFTPVGNTTGGSTTNVSYRYKVGDVEPWANTSKIKDAFATVAAGIDGKQSDNATLILTDAGWQVSKP